VISSRFPPHGGAGVQRTTKFVKYLPGFGYRPHVLTTGPAWRVTDRSLLADVRPETVVVRVPCGTLPSGLPFRVRQMIARWILVVDPEAGWIPWAALAGRRMIKKYGIHLLYSTSAPCSNHLAALLLARVTGLPWVADFRDPWINNLTDTFPTPLHRHICAGLESQVIRRADRVVAVSTPMTREFADRCRTENPEKFVTIPNGFDADDFTGIKPAVRDNRRFTMVYSGSFYQSRTPDCFLDGVAALLGAGTVTADDICVRFVGNMGPAVSAAVQARGLGDVVELTGYVSHREAVSYLLAADLLLLVVNAGRNSQGVFTGKLFEYLAAGRPVLALAPPGCAADLIEEAKAGKVVDPDDPGAVARALAEMIQPWRAKAVSYRADQQVAAQYERRRLTGDLARLLDTL